MAILKMIDTTIVCFDCGFKKRYRGMVGDCITIADDLKLLSISGTKNCPKCGSDNINVANGMDTKQHKKINSLFQKFTRKGITAADLPKAEKLLPNLGERIADFRLLLDMVKDAWAGKFKISPKAMAIIGGAILYVISPIDVIPDFLPVIGWTDDIAVIGFAIAQLSDEVERYKKGKLTNV